MKITEICRILIVGFYRNIINLVGCKLLKTLGNIRKNNFFFFGSEMKYMLIMLIIIKFKDERSFPQDTKPNKSKTPPLYKENYR